MEAKEKKYQSKFKDTQEETHWVVLDEWSCNPMFHEDSVSDPLEIKMSNGRFLLPTKYEAGMQEHCFRMSPDSTCAMKLELTSNSPNSSANISSGLQKPNTSSVTPMSVCKLTKNLNPVITHDSATQTFIEKESLENSSREPCCSLSDMQCNSLRNEQNISCTSDPSNCASSQVTDKEESGTENLTAGEFTVNSFSSIVSAGNNLPGRNTQNLSIESLISDSILHKSAQLNFNKVNLDSSCLSEVSVLNISTKSTNSFQNYLNNRCEQKSLSPIKEILKKRSNPSAFQELSRPNLIIVSKDCSTRDEIPGISKNILINSSNLKSGNCTNCIDLESLQKKIMEKVLKHQEILRKNESKELNEIRELLKSVLKALEIRRNSTNNIALQSHNFPLEDAAKYMVEDNHQPQTPIRDIAYKNVKHKRIARKIKNSVMGKNEKRIVYYRKNDETPAEGIENNKDKSRKDKEAEDVMDSNRKIIRNCTSSVDVACRKDKVVDVIGSNRDSPRDDTSIVDVINLCSDSEETDSEPVRYISGQLCVDQESVKNKVKKRSRVSLLESTSSDSNKKKKLNSGYSESAIELKNKLCKHNKQSCDLSQCNNNFEVKRKKIKKFRKNLNTNDSISNNKSNKKNKCDRGQDERSHVSEFIDDELMQQQQEFLWDEIIREIVSKQLNQVIPLDVLKQEVLKKYQEKIGNINQEIEMKFMKILVSLHDIFVFNNSVHMYNGL